MCIERKKHRIERGRGERIFATLALSVKEIMARRLMLFFRVRTESKIKFNKGHLPMQ